MMSENSKTSAVRISADVARVIDANFNRAREALRVIEDYARFIRNDRTASEAAKCFRHDLALACKRIPTSQLLAARNTPGDVGTSVSHASEAQRSNPEAVFTAAAKRLPEALRTIEEFGKTVNAEFASAIEQLRYRSYELERLVTLRPAGQASFPASGVYVLLTEALCHHDWLDTASAVLEAGAVCVQLREKSLDDAELLGRARRLVELCARYEAASIVNDRADIAVLAGASGVHVGQTDLRISEIRRILSPDQFVGISTHNSDQLEDALRQMPDYVAVGPMYQSPTKPQTHIPGQTLLEEALSTTSLPVVPIGGIEASTACELVAAGAKMLCACSSVISQKDPGKAVADLRACFEG